MLENIEGNIPGVPPKCKRRNGHCDYLIFYLGHVNGNIRIFFTINDFKRKV